jgi:exoribonuclease R
MYYELAQRILDQKLTPEDREKLKTLNLDLSAVENDLKALQTVARDLRRERFERGALELMSSELKFEFSAGTEPTKIVAKKELEIHNIVAEFMIFANVLVAKKIYQANPTAALLR